MLTSRSLCTSALALALTLVSATAFANNTFFLPGDSFFFIRLSSLDMKRIHPQRTFTWGYSLPFEGGYFCGYAGYSRIQLTMPAAMRRSLGRAIKELEPFTKPDKDGQRRAGIFVYNPDFSIHESRIAVQYNENWASETALFGPSGKHARMEDFIRTPDALMEGWRDGPGVPSLNAEKPKIPLRFGGAFRNPVVADEVQLIVVPDREYQKYFARKNGARLAQVTLEGLKRYVAESNRWVEKVKFPPPQPMTNAKKKSGSASK